MMKQPWLLFNTGIYSNPIIFQKRKPRMRAACKKGGKQAAKAVQKKMKPIPKKQVKPKTKKIEMEKGVKVPFTKEKSPNKPAAKPKKQMSNAECGVEVPYTIFQHNGPEAEEQEPRKQEEASGSG
jgi:hypothetical protein